MKPWKYSISRLLLRIFPEIFNSLFHPGINSIRLHHKQSTFSFEYSALNFTQPDRNTYEYMLEGYDENWIYAGNRRRASYTHVKPGEYVFLVRGYNSDGIMSSGTALVNIDIIPPYWRRSWFIAMFIFLISAAVYLVFYLRIRSVRKQNELLEERVAEKTEAIRLQSEKIKSQNIELRKINQEVISKNDQLNVQHTKISEQRDDLMRLTDELQEANQSRLRFFTTISHEFKTPLTLIINPLKGLLENVGELSRDSILNQIKIIYANASKLLVLINELLDFRKGEAKGWVLEISKFDFVSFIRDITGMFSGLATQKEIDLRVESSNTSILLWADANKIEKVVLNLLSNAFRYTPVKGRISIRLSNTLLEDGKKGVEFVIEDNGPGIDPEILEQIFDRFYRTDNMGANEFGGSGLGLSIAKKFIELHQGSIIAESKQGEGARFIFRIPVDNNMKEAKLPETEGLVTPINAEYVRASMENYIPLNINRVETSEDIAKYKLLLIEDDSTLAEYLEDVFSMSYRVIRTDNSASGMQLAQSARPDIIISDIMLPDFDGVELCRKLKSDFQTAHIPIILLTAMSDRANELKGLKSGADDFVTKPFDLEHLLLKIKNLIDLKSRILAKNNRETSFGLKKPGIESEDKPFFEKVVGIIEENISDSNFNVDELCTFLDVSHPQVYRRVKSVTGLSISEFIRNMRLKKAAKLLLSGDFKINEVAYKVGFSDPNYFTKCFTKLYGQTPRAYLKNSSI